MRHPSPARLSTMYASVVPSGRVCAEAGSTRTAAVNSILELRGSFQ